jgi:hypothetical protein
VYLFEIEAWNAGAQVRRKAWDSGYPPYVYWSDSEWCANDDATVTLMEDHEEWMADDWYQVTFCPHCNGTGWAEVKKPKKAKKRRKR